MKRESKNLLVWCKSDFLLMMKIGGFTGLSYIKKNKN